MRPIYIQRVGMVNIKKLFHITTKERLLRYYAREYEKLQLILYPTCSLIAGKKIETSLNIIDLKGGTFSLILPQTIQFIKMALTTSQNYYPESLGIMFIVNTPKYLEAGWNLIKIFLDEKTLSKIHILGTDFKNTLLQYIDTKNLPKFLGGECDCKNGGCLVKCEGPWKYYMDKLPKENNKDNLSNIEFPRYTRPKI